MSRFFLAIFSATVLISLSSSPRLLCSAIRLLPGESNRGCSSLQPRFAEAPEYWNGSQCPLLRAERGVTCDPSHVHIAMTLDLAYLRGSMAAVLSVLKHASCPENVFFHFVATDGPQFSDLERIVRSIFPYLRFKMYRFDESVVKKLISSSVRSALESPLNYARSYLGELLEPCVGRVIYLDSDLVVVDDIHLLWNTPLARSRVIGAPEYCHVNFTDYFTERFWSEPGMGAAVFTERRPCYFNTGVMVMNLKRWRRGHFRERIEEWMRVQKEKRIYELGSLPPFLLVFAGNIEPIDHRWNQHGLGGDNVLGSCRPLHPGPTSLLHWSGKGKPWARLDAGNPCSLDRVWELYDLYRP